METFQAIHIYNMNNMYVYILKIYIEPALIYKIQLLLKIVKCIHYHNNIYYYTLKIFGWYASILIKCIKHDIHKKSKFVNI